MFGLCALRLCYTNYLNSCEMSISQIFLAPEVLQAIGLTDMCIVERGMVCKQQNDFLYSRGGEKRDFVQKIIDSHQSMISGILRSGGGRVV